MSVALEVRHAAQRRLQHTTKLDTYSVCNVKGPRVSVSHARNSRRRDSVSSAERTFDIEVSPCSRSRTSVNLLRHRTFRRDNCPAGVARKVGTARRSCRMSDSRLVGGSPETKPESPLGSQSRRCHIAPSASTAYSSAVSGKCLPSCARRLIEKLMSTPNHIRSHH